MKNEKNVLLRGLLCVLLVFCMCFTSIAVLAAETQRANDPTKTVKVVVAAENIEAGTKIAANQLVIKEVKDVNIPSNIISARSAVEKKYAEADIIKGEYILESQISQIKTAVVNSNLLIRPIKASTDAFISVADYFPPNTGKDVSGLVQALIDQNPGKTIYFPDGVYLFASPVVTKAATRSTTIVLSDGATIKADKKFKAMGSTGDLDALICLAGNDSVNDNRSVGSYYSIMGGTIDGDGVADCLELTWGRETLVRNICLKNPKKIALDVPHPTNNQSSDVDFEDVTIIGNGNTAVTGIRYLAYDNTATTIRIYDVGVGIDLPASGGTTLRDIRIVNKITRGMTGIRDYTGGNFIVCCYVENFNTAYTFGSNTRTDACRKSNSGGSSTGYYGVG